MRRKDGSTHAKVWSIPRSRPAPAETIFSVIINPMPIQRPNSSRSYLLEFARQAAASIPPGAAVLDAGAGKTPYKRLFSHARYESADFCQVDQKSYGEITYVCDLARIPVPDDQYDLVLLTQVLEHVPEPKPVLQELFRVLKPGGAIWLTAPLFFEEHDIPFDFYRYTQYGLKHLLQASGFTVEKLTWLEGYYGALSHQLITAYRALPLRPGDYGGGAWGLLGTLAALVLKPALAVISLLYGRLDLHYKYTARGLCKNYAVVAIKPAASEDGRDEIV
jgi:SAM-dependent methyltransferase